MSAAKDTILVQTDDLKNIISTQKNIAAAVDALCLKLPFSRNICNSIVKEFIERNADLKLIDDHVKINMQTELMINQMSNHEVNELQEVLNSPKDEHNQHRAHSKVLQTRQKARSRNQEILTHDTSQMQLCIQPCKIRKAIENVSFSDKLWMQCLQTRLPQAALETKFFKGMKNGTLNVDSYGPYFIQNIAYMQHGSEIWAQAAVQAHEQNKIDIVEYCKERSKRWANKAQKYAQQWHIKYDGIILDGIAKQYIEYERSIIHKYGIEYVCVAFYTCFKLWWFIGNGIRKVQQNKHIELKENNVYQFWIEFNMDDRRALGISKWLDILYDQNRIDGENTFNIVYNCLKLEINWFKTACNEKTDTIQDI